MAISSDADFDEMLNRCLDILKVKGNDYTVGKADTDRLHNFRTVADFTGLTPKEALGVYLYKHVAAIYAFIKSDGQAESEPIRDRLADVINYCLLLWKLIQEERRAEGRETLDQRFERVVQS